jgi:acylaminoacyl-peptidase
LKVDAETDLEREIQQALDSASFSVITSNGIESILTSRPENSFLLVSMHGGPHGLTQPEYGPTSSVRLTLGFNILELNFSGTTGFGDSIRDRLNGHAGQVEVEECVEVITMVKKSLSPKKLLLHGKSFGGFLSAHLASIVQPDAAVILNSVANIALMHSTSDMDNWGYYVSFRRETDHPPTAEDYMKMYSISPVSRAHLIQCPVFLAAGGADPRVTPVCTLELYRTLKHLNRDVEFYLFPNDGHGFEKIKTGFELLARTYIWALNKLGVN